VEGCDGCGATDYEVNERMRVAGVDLTRIDGIDVMVAQTILAEVGLDMGRWKTEDNFVSWLGLCPDNRITGNKVVRRGTRHVVNRAATSLAANAPLRSQTAKPTWAPYTVVCAPNWAPRSAITAMAHRLARLVYRMLKYGQRYIDKGAENYEQRYRNQQLQFLRKKAAQLGFQLTEAQAPTA
jgi:transposase